MYKLYFDGSCLKNPGGISTGGYVLYKDKNRVSDGSATIKAGNTSSNVAEYVGLILGLLHLLSEEFQDEEIQVIGDSKLVISQMFRGWKIKKGAYIPYAEVTKLILPRFSNIRGKLIPREQNEEADHMSRIYSTDYVDVFQLAYTEESDQQQSFFKSL